MALPPLVRKVVDIKMSEYCKKRIPPELQDEIKLFYRVRGNSVTLFESRPLFSGINEWSEMKIAQFRYSRESMEWTLYCADRNEKWHIYFDADSSRNIEDLIQEVDDDPTCIFWG